MEVAITAQTRTVDELHQLIQDAKVLRQSHVEEARSLKQHMLSLQVELRTAKYVKSLRTFGSRWTNAKQIEAVQRFHTEQGRIPQRHDFNNIAWLPDTSTVCRHFGSLANLRLQAGLDAGLRGRGGSGRGGGWTVERRRRPFGGSASR